MGNGGNVVHKYFRQQIPGSIPRWKSSFWYTIYGEEFVVSLSLDPNNRPPVAPLFHFYHTPPSFVGVLVMGLWQTITTDQELWAAILKAFCSLFIPSFIVSY